MNEPSEISEHLIDVESVFSGKNPRLYKFIPGFIFSYLKRIIHQEQINNMIYQHRDLFGLDFVRAILDEFGINVKVQGTPPSNGIRYSLSGTGEERNEMNDRLSELIPATGRYFIASNHPLGGLDGLAIIHVTGQVRRDLVFPVNDLLMFIPGLKPLFIPINKHGKNTENIRMIEDTFASDKVVLYFPAGLVSRKFRNGIIKDLEWKKTFITRAKKYRRDIIPVYISGRNTDFFYNLAKWRQRLGIKANIEMLYLPGEMFRQKNKMISITFGKPVSYTFFDKTRSDAQWAEFMKEKVYELA
jgi:1-acyl-sn-glycerol-3-phosphate acyltransferase